MNTLANSPVTGHVPALSVKPVIATVTDIAAAVVPKPRAAAWRKALDTLVTIYAYGLLGFGLFFPWLLAAWYAFFAPAAHQSDEGFQDHGSHAVACEATNADDFGPGLHFTGSETAPASPGLNAPNYSGACCINRVQLPPDPETILSPVATGQQPIGEVAARFRRFDAQQLQWAVDIAGVVAPDRRRTWRQEDKKLQRF